MEQLDSLPLHVTEVRRTKSKNMKKDNDTRDNVIELVIENINARRVADSRC